MHHRLRTSNCRNVFAVSSLGLSLVSRSHWPETFHTALVAGSSMGRIPPIALVTLAVLLFEHCTTITLTRLTQQRIDAPRPIPAVLVSIVLLNYQVITDSKTKR